MYVALERKGLNVFKRLPVSRQELGRLRKRFAQLIPAEETSHELRIPLASLLQMPELRLQPFVPLVARLILNRQVADDSASGELVSFDVFMTILSVFNVKQSLEFKRRVLFDIYDQENKGYTTVDDFIRVISEVSRPNAAQKKIICSELELYLAPFVKKSNGGVSGVLFSDFNQVVSDEEVFSILTISSHFRLRNVIHSVGVRWIRMVKWHIGTYARLRPPRRGHECAKFDLERVDDGRFNRTIIAFPPPDDDGSRMHLKQRDGLDFHFSDVFDPSVSQEQVFNDVCLDIVHSALDGYNGTILAYGQTGSGKTYTITGGEHYADRGIIPRVLSTIFEEFEKKPNMGYSCYISYLEIYNENVYDLLDRSHTDRPIEEWTKVLLMDDDEGDMHFRNLGVFEAVSEEEALNLLFLGNMNRVTSDTPMNQASSRSHSIFSVMIESRPVDSDMIVTSKLHLVDLAGSERVYKRDGTQRMRSEGKHINLSLHHLEQVILSLRNKRNTVSKAYHIPYRNSMLTSVLRGSLGGNCKSVFIATVNPESDFLDESISTCRFMQRCSEVAVEIAVNTEVDTEKRLEAVEKLNTELEATNFELQQRTVQLEKNIEAQALQFAKKEQEWEQRLAAAQTETQTALTAAKTARDRDQVNKKIDWMQCEEMVERLLLTGDLPREELDKPRSEGEFQEARRLYDAVAQSIRELGMATALGCLVVLKENTFFASNTAAEIQELMSRQTRTVELLEQRLLEQKSEAELLREQIQSITESQTPEGEPKTSICRSKSHTGALRRHRSSRRQFENGRDASTGGASNSGSDSENDSEASTAYEYDHPVTTRLAAKQRDRKASKRSEYSNPSISEDFSNEDKQTTLRGATATTEDPVPPPRQSGSDLIRMRMELLRIGSLFVKYGRFGKPHVRFVWCSADLEYLNYRKVNSKVPKATIPTRSIVRISIGQDTRVFERAKQRERAPHCFSVEYEENRTLDLEIADGESPEVKKIKRNEWVDALQFLLKLKATPSRRTRNDSSESTTS